MPEWTTLKRMIWLLLLRGASAVIRTVTGDSPLVLENAVAAAIKSLTQYGKCATVDGEIYCNNGRLTAVDDELPAGYKRLLGITFDGSFHYETGEYLTDADDVTMTLNNLSSSGKNLFGSYNGASEKNFSLYIYGSTSGSYFRFGDQLKRPKYGSTGRRTITFGVSGTSGFAEDTTVDPDTFTTPSNVYIGMLPNSTSPGYTGDIIGNITVGTRLKWIPCERESGGVIGYYEAVNGVFLEPVGDGTPVSLGYDTSHLNGLSVVGTPEVLTVGGKNLNGGTIEHKGYTSTGGTSTSTTFAGTLWKIPCKEGDKFTVSWGGFPDGVSGVFINTWLTDGSWNMRQAISASTLLTYTIGAGVGIVNFTLYKTGGITIGDNAWLQVEYGTTATDYEPYVGTQTATVANLFSSGAVHDEQDIISGVITRRVEVSVANGVITLSALDTPVTEHTTPQPLSTVEGTNTLSWNYPRTTKTVEYAYQEPQTNKVGTAKVGTAKAG